MKLTWKAFKVETDLACSYDNVRVYDGVYSSSSVPGALTPFLCGETLPDPVTSTTENLSIVFKSDVTWALAGFQVDFEVVDGGSVQGNYG